MDLDATLKPGLWGLTVLPSPTALSMDDPLANRTLRYWPTFTGQLSANIPLLDEIAASAAGELAMEQEIQESKRLLYVSLTRPRDSLIIALDHKQDGEWLRTLEADWMLPAASGSMALPDGTVIPAQVQELAVDETDASLPAYQPQWLVAPGHRCETVPLYVSPSAIAADPDARIGKIIELGERLELTGAYDPAVLGSALHAVIATTLLGQQATARVLQDYNVHNTISVAAAHDCTQRLLAAIHAHFKPSRVLVEYPIQYLNDQQQIVSGWIDLLLVTESGYVLIDHKSSPRSRSEWETIALAYSGQLAAYARGIEQVTGTPVISRWIHFGVTAGLVQVC
jgi:ATP-dependent exoDNAse (exonuclease V) beta subunit